MTSNRRFDAAAGLAAAIRARVKFAGARRRISRLQHTFYRPVRDLLDGHRMITDAKRHAHVPFDLLLGKFARTSSLTADVEYRHAPLAGPKRSGSISISASVLLA
jgi:hypothetical protein